MTNIQWKVVYEMDKVEQLSTCMVFKTGCLEPLRTSAQRD